MSEKRIGFSIYQEHGITKFTNETDMYIEVSLIPVKPKRKYNDIMVITPGKFVIHNGFPLDLSKVCFRFKTRKEVLDERS